MMFMDALFMSDLAIKMTPVSSAWTDAEKQAANKEVIDLFKRYEDRVTLRGAYLTQAFRADTDLFLWMYAKSFNDLQDLQLDFRRTKFGRAVETPWAFTGMANNAEFNKAHLPSFSKGIPAKQFMCFYPFIRTPEWYLLPAEERAIMLKEHGDMGREFPGILTNGVYAFGLSDFEWLLSFEVDNLEILAPMVRRLRDAKARLYTKYEWPFIVGRYFELTEALERL
jgi:hydrogen peroxide-dependent heme synthase